MSKTKNTKTILLLLISILLTIIISFSFAHFNTKITNNETYTSIATGSGIMEITYSGGENINAPNIFPDNNPFITKEFIITGKNSNPNEDMHYHLLLVLDENTFRSSALTYTLESNNIDDDGYVVPEIITQTGIKTGQREIFLGNGMFTPTNNENKVHSYTLKLFFPKIEHFEHGIDQGKTFKAHIETREGEIYPGYNEKKGVNHPVLFTGMTPVKWDENNIEINTTEDDSDWYDYDEKRWANARTQDGSYWVWIPRYAYKIETCYHMDSEQCILQTGKEAGDIDVKFLKSTTNLTEDNTTIQSTGYEAHVKDTSMYHFLHPAFQFNGEELGFWIAKFEPSVADETNSCYLNPNIEDCNSIELIIKIVPNANAWTFIDMFNSYYLSHNMKSKNEIYGWLSSEVDTHMMTNLEWGAVVYLSQSKFGANEQVWNNSYLYYKTGCGASNVNAFNETICYEYDTGNGRKSSTSHNIYGIYDMSGGTWERVMGNYDNLINVSGFVRISDVLALESKYLTRYYTKPDVGIDYNSHIYGDAIYETSYNAYINDGSGWLGNESGSWYGAYSYLPYASASWFGRGGSNSTDLGAGLYYFRYSSGGAYVSSGFRPSIAPL